MEVNEKTNMEHDDGIDIISEMPDTIVCKILSCLPTKEAVAAKVLSTRWGSLYPFFWIQPIVLDLDDTWFSSHDSFHKFTDKLLHDFHEFQVSVDVLKLTSHNGFDEKKMSWIRSVLQLNIRELSFEWYDLPKVKELPLFSILNGSTALTRLVLQRELVASDYTYRVNVQDDFSSPNLRTLILSGIGCKFTESVFILPNLTTLDLYELRVYYSDENFWNKLINGCPLECLSLRRCIFEHRFGFRIIGSCPLLKNLTIRHCTGCSLELDAPNLKYLVLEGYVSHTLPLYFKSLHSAHIGTKSNIEDLITACSGTVDLYLSTSAIGALPAKLPTFKNLNRLTLGHFLVEGWMILACFLYSAHKLENLTFEKGFSHQDGGYTLFESWVARRSPLSCMELHIKEIEFCVFDETEDEIKLVEYFMNNGKVIETIKLHCRPFKQKSTMKRLLKLPSYESRLIFLPR